jgi:hypothetical protein
VGKVREGGRRSLRRDGGLAGRAVLWANPQAAGDVTGVCAARRDGATQVEPGQRFHLPRVRKEDAGPGAEVEAGLDPVGQEGSRELEIWVG